MTPQEPRSFDDDEVPIDWDDRLIENQLSDEWIARIGRMNEAVNRAELWSLSFSEHPAQLLQDNGRVSGRLIHSGQPADEEISVEICRAAGSESRLEFHASSWPDGFRPLNLVTGAFVFADVSETDFVEKWKPLPRLNLAAGAAKFKPSGQLAAQGAREVGAKTGTTDPRSVEVRYSMPRNELRITAHIPDGHECGFVIVELTRLEATGQPVTTSHAVCLDRSEPGGGYYGGLSLFGIPGSADAKLRGRVRSITVHDLHRLATINGENRTNDFLADQDFLPIRFEASDTGWAVVPKWSEQADALVNNNWQWALQVTPNGKAG